MTVIIIITIIILRLYCVCCVIGMYTDYNRLACYFIYCLTKQQFVTFISILITICIEITCKYRDTVPYYDIFVGVSLLGIKIGKQAIQPLTNWY